MLHKIAVALLLIAVGCYALHPILGAALFAVGLCIETIGWLVWGADFWRKRKSSPQLAENEPK